MQANFLQFRGKGYFSAGSGQCKMHLCYTTPHNSKIIPTGGENLKITSVNPCSWVPLKKLIVAQLLKVFPAF
jgi:hypothetical protein